MTSSHIASETATLPIWRKSSYSGGSGGDCLEVCDSYAPWRKSSYSGGAQADCLEVGTTAAAVPVRDSKDPHGPAVVFGGGAWASFVSAVKEGPLGAR